MPARPGCANFTLASASELADALQATFFPPDPINGYYRSSRFDWGTMLGDVRSGRHTAFCSGVWRQPHDPLWPESGVGLASEWGCGQDGAWCPPGWGGGTDLVSNGVLGYEEAGAGEPFLKIGVGLLRKGSCPDCNASSDSDAYRFNSPYAFAAPPSWRVARASSDGVEMSHQAGVRGHAYRLRRSVRVGVSSLAVTTHLENTGSQAFATPHYSHNFLTVDGLGPQRGWSLRLGRVAVRDYRDSPPWAAPLADYFTPAAGHALRATAPLGGSTKVKATFPGSAANLAARGDFALAARGLSVSKALRGPLPLYGYALYLEARRPSARRRPREARPESPSQASARLALEHDAPQAPAKPSRVSTNPPLSSHWPGHSSLGTQASTLSPEPIQLVALQPGEAATLTQTVTLRSTERARWAAHYYRRGSFD